MSNLLEHPLWGRLNPAHQQLVRMGAPLSPRLNPFVCDEVVITPAISTINSKVPVAYQLIHDGIESGGITPQTRTIFASSGNTGLDGAQICKVLQLPCTILMPNDAPPAKVAVVRALGNPIDLQLLTTNTVARAREMGLLPGHYDTDQYARSGNYLAQKKYFAPQFFAPGNPRIDLAFISGGTLGSIWGLTEYAKEHGIATRFVLAVCAPGEEVPGARDEARIRRDVRGISIDDFGPFFCGNRIDSFLASYALQAENPWGAGGPTSGLALLAALRFIQRHKLAGTLDSLRGPDGKIRVVFFCPDSYLLYADIYLSVLNGERHFESGYVPVERFLQAA